MSTSTNGSSIQVTCPECGTESWVSTGGRAATDFCPSCDYPLFWAAGKAQQVGAAATTEAALYRSPGTSGTTTASSLACPECGEHNPSNGVECLRCGADLHPAPPPPPPPPAAPAPIVIQPPATIVECDHWPTWAVATLSAAATALVAIIALLIWG